MKNLFGFDVKTKAQNSEPFKLRFAEDTKVEEKMDDAFTEIWKAKRQASLPVWLLIASFIFIMGGMIMIVLLGSAETDEEMKTAVIVASVGAGLTVCGLVILLINYLRMRKLTTSAYYQSLLEKKQSAEKLCFEYLGVPGGAEEITLLSAYDEKKNPLFACEKVKIFTENGNLCLANAYEVVAVPLREITAIYSVRMKTTFYCADEDEQMKSAEAKRLGLKINRKNSNYIAAYRYSAHVMHGAEEFEIVIPPYELEKFKKYVNATVIE